MSHRLTSWKVALSTLAAFALGSAPVSHAFIATPADSPEVRVTVTRKALPAVDNPATWIPGATTTRPLAAGQRMYLWSTGLSLANVNAGDNVGNTFSLFCTNSAGKVAPADGEQGAYWATNWVYPDGNAITPTLRWTFIAPAADTYTCRLAVTSYSDSPKAIGDQMKVSAGASIASTTAFNRNDRWTLPATSETTVSDGKQKQTLGVSWTPQNSGNLIVVQDAAITTCKYNSNVPGCSGGQSGVRESKAETWISVQPQSCSKPDIESEHARRTITNAEHHLTITRSLTVTPEQFAGCPTLRLSLYVRNNGGNPVLIEGGLAKGMAATHGVALQ